MKRIFSISLLAVALVPHLTAQINPYKDGTPA